MLLLNGKGSFGLVISVQQIATGQIFAAKIIKKTDPKSNQEEKIIKYLNHPRIIKLHEVINLENYLILLMDLMEGGSLKEFIIVSITFCALLSIFVEGKVNILFANLLIVDSINP